MFLFSSVSSSRSHLFLVAFFGSVVSASALAQTATSTSISSSGSTGNFTLNSTVTGTGPVVPTGSVQFQDASNNNYVLATGTLTAGPTDTRTTQGLNAPALNVVAGDFNGDGRSDIIALTQYNGAPVPISILVSNARTGGFVANTIPLYLDQPGGAAVGDFNGDGKLDAIVLDTGAATASILLGDGAGHFTVSTINLSVFPQGIAVGDFNGDGKLDFAITSAGATGSGYPAVSVYLGNGDGTFRAGPTITPSGFSGTASDIKAVDLNGDGHLDLVFLDVSNNTLDVYLGNGSGGFTPASTSTYATGGTPIGLALGDFNGDGKADVAVSNMSGGSVGIFLGTGTGTFTAGTTLTSSAMQSPIGIAAADFDGDGKVDLVVGDEVLGTVTIYKGDGAGHFSLVYSALAQQNAAGLAVGNFNGDTIPDVAVALAGTSSVVILNSVTNRTATTTVSNVSLVGTGNHNVVAYYPGTSQSASSTSNALPLAAQPVATTLTLAANPTKSNTNQQVALTATITPSTAQNHTSNTELVTFFNGSTNLGTATLSSGVATLNTTSLPTGHNSLTAVYGGDSNFVGSTSNPVAFTVTGGNSVNFTVANATQTQYTSSQNLTATGTFNGPVPTGAVTFSVGGGAAYGANCYLSNSTTGVCNATVATGSFVSGTYPIVVSITADANYPASSATGTLTVTFAKSVTLAVPSITIAPGTANTLLTVNGTFNGPPPTGQVTVRIDSGSFVAMDCGLTSNTTGSCQANYPTGSLGSGTHTIMANLGGDANYNSTNGSGTLTVSGSVNSITIAVSPASATQGTAAAVNSLATFNGPIPGSNGYFFSVDGGVAIGANCSITSSTTAACSGSVDTSGLSKGSHTVRFTVNADSNYSLASGSNTLSVQ